MRRPLFTPTRAVIGLVLLAALVVGGLVWVSVSALRVEAAERTAAARADRAYRERLALWRLDSHMLAPLGLENNRPFNNYTALAPPAAVLVDDAGLPLPNPGRAPSPLLSAELPDWMLLHFQLDAGNGWKSPQVLSPGLEANFQSEPLSLPLTNCTPDRADRLKSLRRHFPLNPTLQRLAELDRQDPDAGLYVVPVPLADEPAADKPTPTADHPQSAGKEWAELARAIECLDDRVVVNDTFRLVKEAVEKAAGDKAMKKAGDGLTALPPPAKKAEATADTPAVQAPNSSAPVQAQMPQLQQAGGQAANPRTNAEQELPPEAKARKGATDSVYVTRGGVYDVTPFNGTRGGLAQQGGYAPAADAKGKPNADAAKKAATPDVTTSPAPGAGNPAAPPPGNPAQPQAPADANAADKLKAEEQVKSANDWSAKVKNTLQGRSRMQQMERGQRDGNDDANRAKDAVPQSKAAEGKGDDFHKGGKSAPRPRLSAGKPAGNWDADADPAEAKAAPIVAPVVVRLGPIRPRWLTSADGEWQLLFVRTAAIGERVVYQGVVVDWAALRQSLTALVSDLFPAAALVPLRDGDDDAPPEGTMSTLPVRLDTGGEPACPDCGWTPLRFGLVLAWVAAVLAMIAVTLGGRAVLAMSERRIRFASAVTHELRTPLTALQLHLDLLNSGMITDEAKKAEYLATIAAEADRLNRLVENVLDFARLEKQSAVTARPVPVGDLLAALRRTWEDRLRADGFELIATATTPPGQTVTADPRVLEQVLGNLIDNARKYAKAATDRRIWVWVKPGGHGRLALEVEDRGPGVPAAERRGIFKPFTRGSGSTDTGGAGLGLSLAKQWAELFGGAMSYRPADGGVGACFRLELPG